MHHAQYRELKAQCDRTERKIDLLLAVAGISSDFTITDVNLTRYEKQPPEEEPEQQPPEEEPEQPEQQPPEEEPEEQPPAA